MLTTELIEQILSAIPNRTVGLLGDLFLDRYLDIDPARDEPSIETGKTAYQVTRVRSQPGALGTVVNNLVALGVGRVVPVAVIGDDGEGYELRQALGRMPGVELGGLVMASDRRTPTYTKPMYGSEELNRLDIKNRTPTPGRYEDEVIRLLEANWSRFDALLVLDQVSEANCGVVTDRVRTRLAELAAADPGKFVLADSRERIWEFTDVCMKPNARECYTGERTDSARSSDWLPDDENAESLVWQYAERYGRALFVTEGERGIKLFQPTPCGWTTTRVPAYPVSGPIDIVGAGDSCSAGIACGMTAGLAPEQAAAFGNLVASITIQQLGTTGTASPEQVRARWREVTVK